MAIHQFENPPAAARDTGERIIGHDYRQAGLFGEEFVDVAQQCAAAGDHDAAVGDVRAKFRGRLLERLLDRADDALQRLLQGLEDFVAVKVKLRGTPSERLRPLTESSRTCWPG